jgi:uncharacterized damage-inducible protein DinB
MYLPNTNEYTGFYTNYIQKSIQHKNLLQGLQTELATTLTLLNSLPTEKHTYRYAEGKWSIKELIVHLSDAERIFSYRALRFARQDKTILAGYDENLFVATSKADQRDFQAILQEFSAIRAATIQLFTSFDATDLQQIGTANDYQLSVRALGYTILGHELHHRQLIQERYL